MKRGILLLGLIMVACNRYGTLGERRTLAGGTELVKMLDYGWDPPRYTWCPVTVVKLTPSMSAGDVAMYDDNRCSYLLEELEGAK